MSTATNVAATETLGQQLEVFSPGQQIPDSVLYELARLEQEPNWKVAYAQAYRRCQELQAERDKLSADLALDASFINSMCGRLNVLTHGAISADLVWWHHSSHTTSFTRRVWVETMSEFFTGESWAECEKKACDAWQHRQDLIAARPSTDTPSAVGN